MLTICGRKFPSETHCWDWYPSVSRMYLPICCGLSRSSSGSRWLMRLVVVFFVPNVACRLPTLVYTTQRVQTAYVVPSLPLTTLLEPNLCRCEASERRAGGHQPHVSRKHLHIFPVLRQRSLSNYDSCRSAVSIDTTRNCVCDLALS